MSENGVYELGALEVRLADVGLDLRLSSKVMIATSVEDDNDCKIRQRLTSDFLCGDGYWKPWVVKSHEYQIRIDLDIASELTVKDKTFAHTIAARLGRSEIWPSVGLDVTSVETCSSSCRTTSWTLSLNYHDQTTSPESMKLHKLSSGVPYHDMKPPPGVSTVEVDAVCVTIQMRQSTAATATESDKYQRDSIANDVECTTFDKEDLFHRSDTAPEWHYCSGADTGIRDSGDLDNMSVGAITSERDNRSNRATWGDYAYLTPPSSQEDDQGDIESPALSATKQVNDATRCLSARCVLSATETGLRYIMCKLPDRRSKVSPILDNDGFGCLPDIAPALWVPEYHRSVAERIVFLPTISHAIMDVSGHSSANSGLRIKAWQLCHRHPHLTNEASATNVDRDDNGTQQAISVRLWTSMASGLNNSKVIRQLQMFSNASNPRAEMNAVADARSMLDETAEDHASDETCDESAFEDLLDLGGEADTASTCDLFVSNICNAPDPTCAEALEDRLYSRWSFEGSSLFDPDVDMIEHGPEIHSSGLCGAMGLAEDEPGDIAGSHLKLGQCKGGSDQTHDSMVMQDLEMGYKESSLVEEQQGHLETAGEETTLERVDAIVETVVDADELQRERRGVGMRHPDYAHNYGYHDELLDF